MSFKDWLPKTEGNKLAFIFAHVSVILFLAWNLMPVRANIWHKFPDRIFATYFWRQVFDPDIYVEIFKSGGFWQMMYLAIICAALITSILSLSMIPFWRFLHATPIIRVPLALFTLAGALMTLSLLVTAYGHPSASLLTAYGLLGMNMFFVSLAMFSFKNELGWKPRALDPRVPRRKS